MTRPLKLFIGSGNLGNAEPDPNSVAAWIPDDGNCSEVLDHQKYPIVARIEEFDRVEQDASEESIDEDDNNFESREKKKLDTFDLIVLGMQESTFEPESDPESEEVAGEQEILGHTEIIDDQATDVEDLTEFEEEEAAEEIAAMEAIANEVDDSNSSYSINSEKEKQNSVATDRSSKVLAESMQQMAKHTKKAAKSAGKAAKSAGKAAKTAGKAAKEAGKTAGKAAKTSATQVAKVGVKSATQVAKVGVKSAEMADKAARISVATVNTLTASREHKKDPAEILVSDGTSVLHQLIKDRLPSYTRLLSFQRGEMRLLVYSRERYHTAKIKSVRAQNTGVAGLANKGGIVAEVVVDDGTVLSFMSCHLEAHEGVSKYAARCSSLGEILKGTKKYAIPSIYPDASLATHFCFVLGDLNFRTRYKGRIKSEEQLEDVQKLVEEKNWKEINMSDELRMALENHECLHGFKTLCCNFPPTFKVERAPGFKYKAQRTPSYTDRILFRTGPQLEKKIRPLAYEPIDDFATSDHKPIRGAFEIDLNRRVFLQKRQHHSIKGVRSSVLSWMGHEENSKHENLHLFLCDIQCDIFPNSEWSSKPDSYVCIVSSPEDILLKKPTKMKQISTVMKKVFAIKIGSEADKADSEEQKGEKGKSEKGAEKAKSDKGSTSGGWPRTGKIKDTHNPDWTNHEIHCILKTHREDESPIILTGAMLHIFVFKHNGRQLDEVIGSYPINLENIFRSCTLLSSHSMRSTWRRAVKRRSYKSIHDAHENIVSVDIDGPLLKNGRQTGVLRCTVDAWWINDAMAAQSKAGGGIADGLDSGVASLHGESERSQSNNIDNSNNVLWFRRNSPKK